MTDRELLDAYAHQRSESAFSELVARHVDLVYSVAKRTVGSPDLAQDIVQAVFVELARRCRELDPDAPLVWWLHVVAHRKAVDLVRREAARRRNEQQAADAVMPEPSRWSEVEPLLDDSVEALAPQDRAAVLLRYFSNKSLRDVGAALGISEDLAQKRVSRALDRLRALLVRRGVVVTASGLATELSAHALQLAPAGLGGAVATSALSAAAGALPAANALAMTTFQKIAISVAVTVAAGVVVFETHSMVGQSRELDHLAQQTASARASLAQLRERHERDAKALFETERAIDSALIGLSGESGDALESQAWAMRVRYNGMKALLRSRPHLSIPELSLVSENEWWEVASSLTSDSEQELRRGLANLRASGQSRAVTSVAKAFELYAASHDGLAPSSTDELAAFVRAPATLEMIQRYEILVTGKVFDGSGRRRTIAVSTPVDPEFDSVCTLMPPMIGYQKAMSFNVRHAQSQFSQANNGRRASTAAELMPYLKWPVETSALENTLANMPR